MAFFSAGINFGHTVSWSSAPSYPTTSCVRHGSKNARKDNSAKHHNQRRVCCAARALKDVAKEITKIYDRNVAAWEDDYKTLTKEHLLSDSVVYPDDLVSMRTAEVLAGRMSGSSMG
jgi:hypothetical protein